MIGIKEKERWTTNVWPPKIKKRMCTAHSLLYSVYIMTMKSYLEKSKNYRVVIAFQEKR